MPKLTFLKRFKRSFKKYVRPLRTHAHTPLRFQMTWWLSDRHRHFKHNAQKEVLGGKDFRIKISFKIADAALFEKFCYLLFHEAFIG